jgi:hypothetical protein
MTCNHIWVEDHEINGVSCELCGHMPSDSICTFESETIPSDEQPPSSEIPDDESWEETAQRLLLTRSWRQTAAEMNCPTTTLYDRLQNNKHEVCGRPPLLSPFEESAMVEWITMMNKLGHPVGQSDIKGRASLLNPKGSFSSTWMTSFLERNKLSKRRIGLMEISRFDAAQDLPRVEEYFKLLKDFIEEKKITTNCLWNLDESGFQPQTTRNYTICLAGRERHNA